MEYFFEIVGVSSILSFFSYQQRVKQRPHTGAEYLATYRCTLDAFIEAARELPPHRGWNIDRVVESAIRFWYLNEASIARWKRRLEDDREGSLVVARVADVECLKVEFENLLKYKL